jgi:large subunit ribosomal protein L13
MRQHGTAHLCVAGVFLLLQRIPERIIEHAVKGMLPKGRLGRDIRLHLKVYKGTEHPHEAQQPTNITSHISKKPKEVAALKQ